MTTLKYYSDHLNSIQNQIEIYTPTSTAGGIITGSTTLTTADSGGTFEITNTSDSTYNITLPVPSTGLNYKFFISDSLNSPVIIGTDSDGTLLFGSIIQNSTGIENDIKTINVVGTPSIVINVSAVSGANVDMSCCSSDIPVWRVKAISTIKNSIKDSTDDTIEFGDPV